MIFFDPTIPETLWFRALLGSLLGGALGSFTTMLSYRLPRRLSIVMPPSHCPTCNAQLRPRDLVPLFSFLIARGHCRACGAPIGWRYFLIELAVTLACLAAALAWGVSLLFFGALILIVALATTLTIQIEKKR